MAIDENGEAGTVTTASTRAAKVIKNGTGDRGRTPGGSGDSGGRGEDTIARSKSFAASTVDGSASPSLRPSARLSEVYPVSTLWKMILENEDVVKGRVYCTDEFSQSIVLQNALVHTTLASEVHIVNAAAVRSAQRIDEPDGTSGENNGGAAVPLSKPLPRIHKKVLEDRERKALRQAEESFRHINQKASLRGQACFERLLKACNEVAWRGESILVLRQIQVDPPYTAESCSVVANVATSNANPATSASATAGSRNKTLEHDSLDRVKKIVESEPTP